MSDIEKKLRDMGREPVDYPPELRSATRAEFTTLVRTSRKKGPGCPLFGSMFILVISLIASIIYIF